MARLNEANMKLMDELRREREKVARAKDDREQDAADLKRIRAERSSLRDELETVKQRAKLRKDELETAKKDLESADANWKRLGGKGAVEKYMRRTRDSGGSWMLCRREWRKSR